MEYSVYHDESKEGGYWHSFVFIPIDKKELIAEHLLNTKNKISSGIRDVSFKNIKKKNTRNAGRSKVIRYWLSYIVAGMQQQKKDKMPMAYCCIDKGVDTLINYLGIRVIILKVRNNHIDMFETMSELEKIETTMRIGLKGGLHYLFSDEQVEVKEFFIDGNEHYHGEHGRDLDQVRIIGKLKNELKSDINISDDCNIVPIAKKDYCPNSVDRIFIQVSDILLGAFRYLHQNEKEANNTKEWIVEPCSELINKDHKNIARMKESRFYKGFSLSEAYIENRKWVFHQLNRPKKNHANKQTSLLL